MHVRFFGIFRSAHFGICHLHMVELASIYSFAGDSKRFIFCDVAPFIFLMCFLDYVVNNIYTHARKLYTLFVYHIALSCFVRIIFSVRIFFIFWLTASWFRTFFFFSFRHTHTDGCLNFIPCFFLLCRAWVY